MRCITIWHTRAEVWEVDFESRPTVCQLEVSGSVLNWRVSGSWVAMAAESAQAGVGRTFVEMFPGAQRGPGLHLDQQRNQVSVDGNDAGHGYDEVDHPRTENVNSRVEKRAVELDSGELVEQRLAQSQVLHLLIVEDPLGPGRLDSDDWRLVAFMGQTGSILLLPLSFAEGSALEGS